VFTYTSNTTTFTLMVKHGKQHCLTLINQTLQTCFSFLIKNHIETLCKNMMKRGHFDTTPLPILQGINWPNKHNSKWDKLSIMFPPFCMKPQTSSNLGNPTHFFSYTPFQSQSWRTLTFFLPHFTTLTFSYCIFFFSFTNYSTFLYGCYSFHD